ncbi:MAG: hypothetical protein JXR51_08110 [Bacteroidales bacterium]|nr:hypothetical protein [Bacteroidales bacterium]MBN2757124.1 hypothetical protein [Bacteroidales bacterium]
MKKIYKYKTEAFLKRGNIYNFKVIRKIFIPNDREYFVLEGLTGIKYLLPIEYYTNYNIKTNSEIECIVDKINCVGRIFLEPIHHYYKVNNSYEFKFISEIEIAKKNLIKQKYYKLKGEYNFTALLSATYSINKFDIKQNKIFEIEKISKATIFLKSPF